MSILGGGPGRRGGSSAAGGPQRHHIALSLIAGYAPRYLERWREGRERGREREGWSDKAVSPNSSTELTCDVVSGVLQNVNVIDVDIKHWITVGIQVSSQYMSC